MEPHGLAAGQQGALLCLECCPGNVASVGSAGMRVNVILQAPLGSAFSAGTMYEAVSQRACMLYVQTRSEQWHHISKLCRPRPARYQAPTMSCIPWQATLERVGARGNTGDLDCQPFYRFIERTYAWHVIAMFAALYALGGLPVLVWGGALRCAWVYHITWFVNSASHVWGYQSYATGDQRRGPVSVLAFPL